MPPGDYTEEWLGWEPDDASEVEAMLADQLLHLKVGFLGAQQRLGDSDAELKKRQAQLDSAA